MNFQHHPPVQTGTCTYRHPASPAPRCLFFCHLFLFHEETWKKSVLILRRNVARRVARRVAQNSLCHRDSAQKTLLVTFLGTPLRAPKSHRTVGIQLKKRYFFEVTFLRTPLRPPKISPYHRDWDQKSYFFTCPKNETPLKPPKKVTIAGWFLWKIAELKPYFKPPKKLPLPRGIPLKKTWKDLKWAIFRFHQKITVSGGFLPEIAQLNCTFPVVTFSDTSKLDKIRQN